jgi:hypothetical protein
MNLELKTSTVINATPKQVWDVFTQFDKMEERGYFVSHISGEMKEGNKINITAGGMQFKPLLLSYKPEQELIWLGNFLIKGLFDGKHQFYLLDNGNGTTTFHQNENFSGILVRLFKGGLLSKTRLGFEDMNAKLKNYVENK